MNTLIIIICIILILIGLIGIILPALPGVVLVFSGVLVYALYHHFAAIGVQEISFLAVLLIISLINDSISSLIGAKKLGATKYGIWGGLIGLLVGLIFSPFGFISVIIMPLVGTVVGELIGGKKLLESSKIGLGTLIGFLISIAIDFTIAGIMIFTFLKAIL